MGHRKQKAMSKTVAKGKKKRQVDPTKLVAVLVMTIIILLTLWVFNPSHFFGVMAAFVVGTLYGLALPHMAQRMVH